MHLAYFFTSVRRRHLERAIKTFWSIKIYDIFHVLMHYPRSVYYFIENDVGTVIFQRCSFYRWWFVFDYLFYSGSPYVKLKNLKHIPPRFMKQIKGHGSLSPVHYEEQIICVKILKAFFNCLPRLLKQITSYFCSWHGKSKTRMQCEKSVRSMLLLSGLKACVHFNAENCMNNFVSPEM